MTARRYSDTEIAAIFRTATEDPQQLPREVPREEGLSLVELQAIGREVGIAPEAVHTGCRKRGRDRNLDQWTPW
jgi:hypothetical protein